MPSDSRTYSTGRPELDAAIVALVSQAGVQQNRADLINELITTALKLHLDQADRGDLKLASAALKELRHTFRVYKPLREVRKVAVFGSARTLPNAPEYIQAREFGRVMAEAGYMVITGGGGGIMLAANEGAGRDRSLALNIRLPFEQSANPIVVDSPQLITYRYFFTRKLAFVKESDAIVLMPGGFGTMDEGFESLTLLQTGKAHMRPVVCLDAPGGTYWTEWLEFIRSELMARRYLSDADESFIGVFDNVEQSKAHIDRFYRRYHSMRNVRDKVVVRLSSPLEESQVLTLSSEFSDMLTAPIVTSGALPEEADEPTLADLPRLVVPFDRRRFGRLRAMIDRINDF